MLNGEISDLASGEPPQPIQSQETVADIEAVRLGLDVADQLFISPIPSHMPNTMDLVSLPNGVQNLQLSPMHNIPERAAKAREPSRASGDSSNSMKSWRELRATVGTSGDHQLMTPPSSMSRTHSESFAHTERVRVMVDLIDRMREAPSDQPQYLLDAFNAPAKALASTFSIPRVHYNMTIRQALGQLRHGSCLLLAAGGDTTESTGKDRILPKHMFLERALTNPGGLDAPVAQIIKGIEPCPTVNQLEPLSSVMIRFASSHHDLVGTVNEQGGVTGVVLVEDIFDFIMDKMEGANAPEKPESVQSDHPPRHSLTFRHVKSLKEVLSSSKEITTEQKTAQEWSEAWVTECFVNILIVAQVILQIHSMRTDANSPDGLADPISLVVSCIIFCNVFEGSIRIFGYRYSLFNGARLFETLDLFAVMILIITHTLYLASSDKHAAKTSRYQDELLLVKRVAAFIRLVRPLRQLWLLEGRKKRYRKDGFDLDLTYVTPGCIAMALPAVGAEANFLNNIDDVIRFFHSKHEKHYFILNLCAEKSYDPALFEGRVQCIPTDEDQPPLLDEVFSFLDQVSAYMDADPRNVFAVHCKHGTGRTGVMVCAWLMFSTFCESADDAMDYFAKQRVGEHARAKVAAIPGASQRRYVHYVYSALVNGGYRTNRLVLKRITLYTCPRMDLDGGCDPWVAVHANGTLLFASKDRDEIENMAKGVPKREFGNLSLEVSGDIQIVLYDHDNFPPRDERVCSLTFHTAFVGSERMAFPKEFIDTACDDKRCKVFSKDFKIEVEFESIPRLDFTGGHLSDASLASRRNSLEPDSAQPASLTMDRTGSGGVPGVRLGEWRRLGEPSQTIIDTAAAQRGRVQDVTRVGTAYSMDLSSWGGKVAPDGTERVGEGWDDVTALEPVADSLLTAQGPPPLHHEVNLIRIAAVNVHEHRHARKLLKEYQKGKLHPSTNPVVRFVRGLVSGNKRRFTEEGYDLDLTYVTPRIIAMGWPSRGLEGWYRNSDSEVYRFFQERHAGHFRVVNLVSERAYNLDMFHGAVVRYPFPDHNPPAMELLMPCCAQIHGWLQKQDDNVIVIHCKAGKGRTGLIIICYLMYAGLRRTALSARAFYDFQRTKDQKGLTIISQIRYAHYFEEQLRRVKQHGTCPVAETEAPALLLLKIRIHTIPKVNTNGGCSPFVTVGVKSEHDLEEHAIFSSRDHDRSQHVATTETAWDYLVPFGGLRVAGDVHVALSSEGTGHIKKHKGVCWVWLHTRFCRHPPSVMGGQARPLTPQEVVEHGLVQEAPASTEQYEPSARRARSSSSARRKGSASSSTEMMAGYRLAEEAGGEIFSLKLHKHEIDQAAKDKKHKKFSDKFAMELFFQTLEGHEGVGPALDRARSTATPRVLYAEKEQYQRYCNERAMLGQDAVKFEDYLLTADKQRLHRRGESDHDGARSSNESVAGVGGGRRRLSNASNETYMRRSQSREGNAFKELTKMSAGRYRPGSARFDAAALQSADERMRASAKSTSLRSNMTGGSNPSSPLPTGVTALVGFVGGSSAQDASVI